MEICSINFLVCGRGLPQLHAATLFSLTEYYSISSKTNNNNHWLTAPIQFVGIHNTHSTNCLLCSQSSWQPSTHWHLRKKITRQPCVQLYQHQQIADIGKKTEICDSWCTIRVLWCVFLALRINNFRSVWSNEFDQSSFFGNNYFDLPKIIMFAFYLLRWASIWFHDPISCIFNIEYK